MGSTTEGVAKGGSSLIWAVRGTIHSVLSGADDLDQKIVESIGDASSKIITSTGGAICNTLSGFCQFFHGFLGGIGGTITWICILIFKTVIVFIVYQLYKPKTLCVVSTLETPPKIAGKPATNITGNQTVAIIMKKDASLEALTLGLSILSADVSLPTVGIVDTGSPNTFISNQKHNQFSVTISPPDAEAPSFVTVDNANLEILGQITISFILKDAGYTYSVYVDDNLLTDVIFGLDFLSFNGAQIDLINRSIYFDKSHICHTGRYLFDNITRSSNDSTKAYTSDEILQQGIVTKIYISIFYIKIYSFSRRSRHVYVSNHGFCASIYFCCLFPEI